MSEQLRKRTDSVEPSPIDHLLRAIRELSQIDPPPAIRERLIALSSQRLKTAAGWRRGFTGVHQRPSFWLKPAIVMAFLIALSIAAVVFVHFRRSSELRAANDSRVISPAASNNGVQASSAAHSPVVSRPRSARSRPRPRRDTLRQQMTIWLPYSDSAVVTGTATTIQVSMSPSDLLSLGFPVSQVFPDRWVVAELTMGADGLPRAVSLPLPLEVIKERK